jgi:hypothetical protein
MQPILNEFNIEMMEVVTIGFDSLGDPTYPLRW